MTELFPQSEININVQVLQSDGGKQIVLYLSQLKEAYIILPVY